MTNSVNTPPKSLGDRFSRQILHLVDECKIDSITLDIFDTVLMRRVWPEEKQFYTVAKQWQPIISKLLSSNISASEILQWRIYARQEWLGAKNHYRVIDKDDKNPVHHDITLEIWFSGMLQLLAEKHDTKLTSSQVQTTTKKLIEIELATEQNNLDPNQRLIRTIQYVKKLHPKLKVYFISDMYLTTAQIKHLLNHFRINIFDDGISSVDLGYGKFDSRAYSVIHNKHVFGNDFDIARNLHIGDNQNSDVNQARTAGSASLLYHTPRLRRLRTALGGLYVHNINRKMVRHDSELYDQYLSADNRTPADLWRKFGVLFSQPFYNFIMHVGIAAKTCPDTTFLMVSSEAKEFYRKGTVIFPSLFSAPNIRVAKKLNRRCVFRAFAYLLATDHNLDYNAESIFESICMGEMKGQRRELYEFFFDKDYPYSELNLNTRSDKDFYKAFVNDIKKATPEQVNRLRKAYEYTREFYPKPNDQLVIVDVGWGGTIQVMLREILRLEGIACSVEGLYIGTHHVDRHGIEPIKAVGYLMPNVFSKKYHPIWNAVIWEYAYTNKIQFPEDQSHLSLIGEGFEEGAKLFKSTIANPNYDFLKVTSQHLKKLVSHPTRKEVEILGSINFDFGFVDEGRITLVNTSYSLATFWKRTIRHPRATLRNVIFAPNAWSAAYIKYYHLAILRPLLRIWSIIRRRSYM